MTRVLMLGMLTFADRPRRAVGPGGATSMDRLFLLARAIITGRLTGAMQGGLYRLTGMAAKTKLGRAISSSTRHM